MLKLFIDKKLNKNLNNSLSKQTPEESFIG